MDRWRLTRQRPLEARRDDAEEDPERESQARAGDQARGPVGHHGEDQDGHAHDQQGDGAHHHLDHHVPDRDHAVLASLSEHAAVEHDRGHVHADRDTGDDDEREIDALLPPVERREDLGERQGQQEAGQQLKPGLGDPELLQQLVPVPVESLALRLVPLVVVGARRHGRVAGSSRCAPLFGYRPGRSSPLARRRSGWKPWSMPHRIARDREVTPILRYAERM